MCQKEEAGGVNRIVKEVNLILSLIQTPTEIQMKRKKSFKKYKFILKIKMKPCQDM